MHPLLTEPVEVREAPFGIEARFGFIRVGAAGHYQVAKQVVSLIRETRGALNGRAAASAHINLAPRQR